MHGGARVVRLSEHGRKSNRHGQDAKASLLLGSELAGESSGMSLHAALEANRDEMLEEMKEVMAPRTNAEYTRLLRVLESWMNVVVPDEAVDLVHKPEGGHTCGEGRGPEGGTREGSECRGRGVSPGCSVAPPCAVPRTQ